MRRAALAAMVAGALLAGCGRAHPAPAAPAAGAAQRFLDRYVAPDGRVVRHDQGGDTVSEGQAYAMLVAAWTGDRRRFDRTWAWTRRHLRQPDGLLAWHWAGGRVLDAQSAADADLDAAHALLIAARRFHRPALRRQARRMGRAILRHETAGGQLVAGPWARPGRVVNPSYTDPDAEAALAALGPRRAWRRVRAHGVAAAAALTGGGRLPPDWASALGSLRPTGPPGQDGAPPVYGYDAVRLPIRFGASCDPAARRVAARLWPLLRRWDPAWLPRGLDGSAGLGVSRQPVALVASAAAAHAAGHDRARDRLLRAATALERTQPTYYGAAWVALGRLMLRHGCRR